MLTPSFEIDQNSDFVIVNIRVPYIKISEAEFDISGNEFKFFCKPYFLRLHLPRELVEDGRERACYDVDRGVIVVYLPKQNSGEHFENLGMITSLLSKKPVGDLSKIGRGPLIETVSVEECAAISEDEEDDFDWQMEQQLPNEEEEAMKLKGLPAYGFAEQHKGVFSKLQEEIPSIVDCPDPDHMTPHERKVGRIAHEESSFDPEYYLADLMDNVLIESLLLFETPWKKELQQWRVKQLQAQSSAPEPTMLLQFEPDKDIVPFTDQELQQLKDLPNKEFLFDKAMRRVLYLGLVDIVFAFAYNYRSTEGEDNVESAWTVCKISSTLSWLEVYRGSVHEVIYCCLRRALCYPLYRHWKLALTVLQDTKDLFKLGRRKLLQCLLSLQQILNSCEPNYVLNNLYVTDYCIWIQKASAKQIQKLSSELDEVSVDISSIGWDLPELENAANMVLAEEVLTEEEQEVHNDTATNDEAVSQGELKTRVESSCSSVSSSDSEEESDGCSTSCSDTCKETSCGSKSECIHLLSVEKPSIIELKDSHKETSCGSSQSECSHLKKPSIIELKDSHKETSCGSKSECSHLEKPSIIELKDDVKLQTCHQDSYDLCRDLHDMKLQETVSHDQ